jgi:hypothetical protein
MKHADIEKAQWLLSPEGPFSTLTALDLIHHAALKPSIADNLNSARDDRVASVQGEDRYENSYINQKGQPIVRRWKSAALLLHDLNPSDHGDSVDFNEKVRMRQSPHLHRRACCRRCTEDASAHLGVSEEQVDVGYVCCCLHQIAERRAGRDKTLGEICGDLLDLSAHVADTDDVSCLVSRKLSGHVDRAPSGNCHDVRIKDVAIQAADRKTFGLNAIKLDHATNLRQRDIVA